jgi:hypothetical protein
VLGQLLIMARPGDNKGVCAAVGRGKERESKESKAGEKEKTRQKQSEWAVNHSR